MATTYYSDRVDPSIPARSGIGVVTQVCTFAVAANLVVNDIIQLFKVPKNAVINDIWVSSDGTQGANTDSVFTVGDGADTDRFITTAGGTILRSGGGLARMNAFAGAGYQYSAEDTVDLKITTVGTGQTTGGTINAGIMYSLRK
jgi:hypothetical protein